MSLSFMRIDGKLHWFVDSQREFCGWSYPVFHRGSLRFLISILVPRLRRRYFSPPSVADLEHAKRLQDWYDSLPPDPTKPLRGLFES